MHPLLTYPAEALTISPWCDDARDRNGFDPRSAYVEEFWLGVLGPSTTWLARRLAAAFDDHPGGFDLPLADTARALGLGDRGGRHSPFLRSVNRLLMFDLATAVGPDHLAVRRRVPPLPPRHLGRLDPQRRALHEAWVVAPSSSDAGGGFQDSRSQDSRSPDGRSPDGRSSDGRSPDGGVQGSRVQGSGVQGGARAQ